MCFQKEIFDRKSLQIKKKSYTIELKRKLPGHGFAKKIKSSQHACIHTNLMCEPN